MLTCKNVSATVAKDYFKKGFYESGRWFGKAAERLQLKGTIDDHAAYCNLLDGLSPIRKKRLTGRKLDSHSHRAAIDCIFNAPKSVSVQALVAGDDRVLQAHRIAVEKTLELMESRYAHTRTAIGMDRQRVVRSGKLAIAVFDHIENRELEPHLHTHCVVMNFTLRSDRKWRALHNDAIYRHQKVLGLNYQHHLALELQKVGYKVKAKGRRQFEIVGYKDKDLKHFSKRREAIVAKAGEGASVRERIDAWRNTRLTKRLVDHDKLKAKWKEQAIALGMGFPTPAPEPIINNPHIPAGMIGDAIAHCSEGGVAFFGEELEKYILSKLPEPIDPDRARKLIFQDPKLIALGDSVQSLYTTGRSVERELATISLMQAGKGKVAPIMGEPEILQVLEPIPLSRGEYAAIITGLTTGDRVIAWQTPISEREAIVTNYALMALDKGFKLKALAPNSERAGEIKDEFGLDTHTFDRIYSDEPVGEKEIWLVSDAELLNVSQAHDLLKLANDQDMRLLLVGDVTKKAKRISSAAGLLSQGNPLKSLENGGMTTIFTDDYTDERELKVTLDLLDSGNIPTALSRLEESDRLMEVSGREKIGAIVGDYLSLTPEEREETEIVVGDEFVREDIISDIRRGLKEKGELGVADITLNLPELEPKPQDRQYQIDLLYRSFDPTLAPLPSDPTREIKVGDYLTPAKNKKKSRLFRGKFYRVVAKEGEMLTLSDSRGETFKVHHDFEKTLHRAREMELTTGDQLMWTGKGKKRYKGEKFKVASLQANQATIEYRDGRRETLELDHNSKIDHSLVLMAGSGIKPKAKRLLIATDHLEAKDIRRMVLGVKGNLKLYTGDKSGLAASLLRTRRKPIDILRERVVAGDSLKVPELKRENVAQVLTDERVSTEKIIKNPPYVSMPPREFIINPSVTTPDILIATVGPGDGDIDIDTDMAIVDAVVESVGAIDRLDIDTGLTTPDSLVEAVDLITSDRLDIDVSVAIPDAVVEAVDSMASDRLDIDERLTTPDSLVDAEDTESEMSALFVQLQVERLFDVLADYWDSFLTEEDDTLWLDNYELDFNSETRIFSISDGESSLSAFFHEGSWQYRSGGLSLEVEEYLRKMAEDELYELEELEPQEEEEEYER
ncbi:MAG: hypothetical protein N5P05_004444 (plasmid) [Chroococcopsis gigantea SAG 12.99]|jgi:conjugative relaxase-like TrwC/TraI family protein|nr:relaxase domain-containing protein [Chlorogloea purpurea SAG 13.99]MDV3002789.1 hypothetical protein [Chroococcopsis gigantea SAG 12.99]